MYETASTQLGECGRRPAVNVMVVPNDCGVNLSDEPGFCTALIGVANCQAQVNERQLNQASIGSAEFGGATASGRGWS